MTRKAVSVFLSMLLITSMLAAPVYAQEDDVPTSETVQIFSREVPCYLGELDSSYDLPLYFINDADDLPYINLKDMADLLVTIMDDPNYGLRLETDDYLAQLTRENDYSMLFDFREGTISFDDYDAFVHTSDDSSLLDIVGTDVKDEEGNPLLLERINKGSFDRYGKEITLNLADYDIHLYRAEEEELYLAPMQTMGDFLISARWNYYLLFNGESVYLSNARDLGSPNNGLTPLGKSYYSAGKKEMSEELAWFNYCELCLALDHLYGLKEIHDITSFDLLFSETGYKALLSSTDPSIADSALSDFIYYYLDDLHSGFQNISFRTEELISSGGTGLSGIRDSATGDLFSKARAAAGREIPSYEEVGNTAYITFDNFYIHNGPVTDYYDGTVEVSSDPADASLDTIALIIYAHEQICREDSPIENVVLDLSLNGGGVLDAGAYVVSWFLGDAAVSLRSSLTGAISTGTYRADTNLDRAFDERDTVSDKHLFCLIGPYSFSCGNLVPAMLKDSHKVTILGKTSGGGSCSVLSLSTANGAMFRISSLYRMSDLKNGSYYDIDTGVDPDCIIVKPENFYNREALTDYINNLF